MTFPVEPVWCKVLCLTSISNQGRLRKAANKFLTYKIPTLASKVTRKLFKAIPSNRDD